MYDELMKLSKEELKDRYLKQLTANREGHDTAVLMGTLGVSPKHYEMYQESIAKINNLKSRGE